MNELGAWRFAHFLLDTERWELRRDGRPVALSPKELETLRVLVESSGRLVSKEELISRVWPDSFVGDSSLARNISALRRTLGRDLIQTVARRGYRFVSAATWEPSSPTSPKGVPPEVMLLRPSAQGAGLEQLREHTPNTVLGQGARNPQLRQWQTPEPRWRARSRISLGLLLVAVMGILAMVTLLESHSRSRANAKRPVRIAVLPFVNLTGHPNEEYLCDGLMEAMIVELSRLNPDRLSVIARTSAIHYKGTGTPIPQIGRELNVDYVLESSVRGSSEHARITTQLVRASDATPEWTGEYERDLKDIASVQQQVAMGIAEQIQVNLNVETTHRLHQVQTVDPETYRDYLLGQFYWNKRDRHGSYTALEYFQKAVERDPQFALGWTGIADAYIVLAQAPKPRATWAKSRSAVQRALELDQNLPQAYTALAYLQTWEEWDWAAAEANYKHALALDPNDANAHHWYALYLIGMKRPQQSIREIRRAIELDPLSLAINYNTGFIYTLAGMRREAEDQLKRALQIDPNSAIAHGLLAIVYQRDKDYERSLAEFRTAQRLSGGPVPYLAGVASVEGRTGDSVGARKHLNTFCKLHEEHLLADSSLVWAYAGLGDKNSALRWLASAVDERSVSAIEINNDTLFDGLRDDPRFIAVERKMNLPP